MHRVDYVLRPIGRDGDIVLVHAWRNDPVTRIASFDTSEKTREQMQMSLDDWVRDDPLSPHLLERDGGPVAFLRFSRPRLDEFNATSDIEISIHVSPDSRQRGVGAAALRCADALLGQAGIARIVALVKKDNPISQRLFSRCGYAHAGDTDLPGANDNSVMIYLRSLG